MLSQEIAVLHSPPRVAPPHVRLRLVVPLVLGALLSLTIGVVARATALSTPHTTCSAYAQAPCAMRPFFTLFFSDPIHLKVWLATAALVLGMFQVFTSARVFELVRFPPQGRFWARVHRTSGWLAIGLTLPVAYNCIFLLGFQTFDARVLAHSLFGSAFYGTFLGKVWLVRGTGYPGWALAIAGGLLFAILLGLWLTSSLWFFRTYGISF
jgi:hypothetical protein